MIRVLFVDDEQRILDGLGRLLRSKRDDWQVELACGGEAALVALEERAFDVVVSDMRMPGMDGVELLSRVKESYPETIRIVFSGHSDPLEVMRVVKASHQFLAKPCDPIVLESTIGRACALKTVLGSSELRRVVSKVESLPTLPQLYQDVLEELESEEPSPVRIGDIISADPGMTVNVLKLVNSPFFGLRRQITQPGQAVTLLGTNTVKTLVLGHGLFRQFDAPHVVEMATVVARHGLATAHGCKALAGLLGMSRGYQDDAFTAGMLHDLGKLVLCDAIPEVFAQIIDDADEESIPLGQVEQRVLGTNHGAVGAYLMGLWGLPDSIVEAVAWHVTPHEVDTSEVGLTTMLHVADAVAAGAAEAGRVTGSDQDVFRLDWDFLEDAGLSGTWPRWKATCLEALERGSQRAYAVN